MSQERHAHHEQRSDLAAHARQLRAAALQKLGATTLLDRVAGFAQRLRERYPDFALRRAYHALIGSTPRPGAEYTDEDFSGDDSVLGFLESLAR